MIIKVAATAAALTVVTAGALLFGLWRLAVAVAVVAGDDDE